MTNNAMQDTDTRKFRLPGGNLNFFCGIQVPKALDMYDSYHRLLTPETLCPAVYTDPA